jgi:beta-N-acetylhexosaminidase
MKKRLVDLDQISDAMDSTEETESAQHVSDRAVTLIKNEKNLLPLASSAASCLIVVNERRASIAGQRLVDSYRHLAPKSRIAIVDASMNTPALAASVGETSNCSAIVVAAFATVTAYRGSVGLGGELTPFIAKLTEGNVPVAVVAMGNPYLLTAFPKTSAYLATFSSTPPSEASAAKALFGEIPITGHSPVTIPSFAKYGDGIQLAAHSH